MNFLELSVLALGLSMDAFAVAVCLGITMAKVSVKKALVVGLYFGSFQAGMPALGYIVAIQFAEQITQYSHWVVFGLLLFLGVKMIWGSFKKDKCADRTCATLPCSDRKCPNSRNEVSLKPLKMVPLALATSVDAMAVGVSFAFLQVPIMPAISLIGIITLALSILGVKIGSVFGARFKSKAELAGGVILVSMGLWIVFNHLY
ncbi:MAG: manganese efflux pump MntP family protein [Defluviitaleaceae bacterium]|nr:manganese efflux pump MntP family protein [Defluviitaleaceae bacterium]